MRLAWAWMAWAQGSLLCCLGARRVFSHMLASRKAAGAPAWHTLEGLRSGWYFIASLRNARLMSFLLASFFTPSTLYGSSAALWSQHTMHRRIVTCTRKVRRMAECDRRVWQGLAGFGRVWQGLAAHSHVSNAFFYNCTASWPLFHLWQLPSIPTEHIQRTHARIRARLVGQHGPVRALKLADGTTAAARPHRRAQ